MGWNCYLTTDRKIPDTDIEKILLTTPEHLRGLFERFPTKQSWGWPSGVDICKPSMRDEYDLRLGGSYGLSGKIAEEYVEWFTGELVKLGYQIKSKKFNW